jgi:hypothetical protein
MVTSLQRTTETLQETRTQAINTTTTYCEQAQNMFNNLKTQGHQETRRLTVRIGEHIATTPIQIGRGNRWSLSGPPHVVRYVVEDPSIDM